MSDFEISENEDCDEYDYDDYNNLSCPSSDTSNYETENDDEKEETSYIIDMNDEEPDTKIVNPEPILKTKLTLKTKLNNTTISTTSNTFNTIFTLDKKKTTPDKIETKLKTSKTSKLNEDTETTETTDTTNIIDTTDNIDNKVISKAIKLTKKEQCFEFNPETIDFFTKDLDFKKILIKNSHFTNDIQVICLLLKYKIITDYCCSIKKCKVKTLWLDKPIQLILHRKNNIENDLSSFNLELICGNCYLCMFGLDIFKKKEKEIVFKCNICNFPLVQFNNQRKKKGTCLACEKKMSNLFTKNIEGEYYDKVKALYNDNPLLSEENKHNNNNYYNYNNGTKYKPSSTSTKVQAQSSSVGKPVVISLNMTIPNMDDLIDK